MRLEFIHRDRLDEGRWDGVIARSLEETLYPYTWYLDAVAMHWTALVMDDYRYVMPLVWKQKYGLKYMYQPYYTQQLGIFSREHVDPELIQKVLSVLYRKFRFANFNLNVKNLVGENKNWSSYDKTNYVLDLTPGYDKLSASFSTNARRNIKRSFGNTGEVEKGVSCEELIAFKRENDTIKRSEEDYSWLLNLLQTITDRDAGLAYGIRAEGKLIAAAFFAFSHTRAIYLLSASNGEGKEQRSMFKIVDSFIRKHAGTELKLDFEGSNIPNVARFFAGFGARPEIYQGIDFNRLPVFLNKLRKHD